MRNLCFVALTLLSNALLAWTMSDVSLAKTMCKGYGFVPVACHTPSIVQTFAGDDGVSGNAGRIGMVGPIGLQGVKAPLCLQPRKSKIACTAEAMVRNFLISRKEVRWMDSILHILYGYDIGELTKDELVKLVLSQHSKIIDDRTAIEVLDTTVNKLQQDLNETGRTGEVKLQEVVKENTVKTEKIKQLTIEITTLHKQVEGIKTKDKTIVDLNKQVTDLSTKLKESGKAVEELGRAQGRVVELQREIATKAQGFEKDIKNLKDRIKTKTTESNTLSEQITVLKGKIEVQIAAAKALENEKQNLQNKMTEATNKCHAATAAHNVAMKVLEAQVEQLKSKCKAFDSQSSQIHALQQKIQEMTQSSGRNTEIPVVHPQPTINIPKAQGGKVAVYSSDTADGQHSQITSIDEADLMLFKKYFRNGAIVLPGQAAKHHHWISIIRRGDGSVDFKRKFSEYEDGFGNFNAQEGEFWLGLKQIHALTKHGDMKLRVQLTDHKDKSFYAEYRDFMVGEGTDYRLTVGGFNGNTYDALKYHNGQRFSALDRDQDATTSRHCAANTGGWWYKRCQFCLLTGTYHKNEQDDKTGVRWYDRRVHSRYYSWKKAVMLIKLK